MKQMRKGIACLAALCMAMSLFGCSGKTDQTAAGTTQAAKTQTSEATEPSTESAAVYQAGTYEGVGTGMGGEVHVSVTFDDTSIVSVEVGENAETPLISENALTRIPEDIVKYQSLAVDTVSGATVSSWAVLTAVSDAVAQAGGDVEALSAVAIPAAEKAADETITVDVLVVGGGLSGMSAAYDTANAGLNTLIIEKLESWGGSSARSGGAVCYATEEDDETGYFSAEDFYQWFKTMGHGQINDELVKKIAYNSGETVQWMRNDIGYNPPYEMVETFVDGTVARLTNPGSPTEYVTGCGGAMMKIFSDRLNQVENLSMMNKTRATELLTDESGAVVGAVAERDDGSILTIEAKAVILATGGWAAGTEYMDQWAPGMKKAYNMACVGCTGDGVGLSEAVGAKITSDTPAFAGGVYGAMVATPSNYLLVDGNGSRFIAEDTPACYMMAAMMRNETGVFWEIYDEAQSEGMFEGVDLVLKADTLEELAGLMGADPDTLQATVDRYNELAGKEDADFGKAAEAMTGIGEGPYYAVNVMTYILTAYAGPDVTADCEVLSTEGNVIPGLYAIGELIATNIYGYDDGGHGATLQYCMSTGRIAAAAIAAAQQ